MAAKLNTEELTGILQARASDLILEIEDELGRPLDDEERDSVLDDFLAELDDEED